MKKEKSRQDIILYFLVIAIILFVIAAYFLLERPDFWRGSFLVGDSICGSFGDSKAQDNCCEEGYKGSNLVSCEGNWIYLNPVGSCQFVCSNAEPICEEDIKTCENGMTVIRNASLECDFNSCFLNR